MKRAILGVSILALGFAASPALADFAVVKFKDTGACRAWYSNNVKPWGAYQVLWVKTPSWDVAQTKGNYAMAHRWCKTWYK